MPYGGHYVRVIFHWYLGVYEVLKIFLLHASLEGYSMEPLSTTAVANTTEKYALGRISVIGGEWIHIAQPMSAQVRTS